MTASTAATLTEGWLGKAMKQTTLPGFHLAGGNESAPQALTGAPARVPSVASLEDFQLKTAAADKADKARHQQLIADAMAALTRLDSVVRERYEVPDDIKTKIALTTGGNLTVGYSGSYDYESMAYDLKDRFNAEIEAENERWIESNKSEISAWEVEMQEKQAVIDTATYLEDVLSAVPECRANLPTEYDRQLTAKQGWTGGMLAAPVELEAEIIQ